MPPRSTVVEYWDAIVSHFLEGDTSYSPEPLKRWLQSYSGRGAGAVVLEALPEPYIGDLAAGRFRAVILALNPGEARLDFQGRAGVFADEIRALGSYHFWAATLPYFGEKWRRRYGKNRFHESRLRFLRTWFGENFRETEMLTFELYPWHSKIKRGDIRPDPVIIREFIWKPIADLGNPTVFAFGADWMRLVVDMGVQVEAKLGGNGTDYGSTVSSRCVLVGRTTEGGPVVVEKHSGSAGPPRREEAKRLQEYLRSKLGIGL